VLVALGSPARSHGGINALKNIRPDRAGARAEVYGQDKYLFPTLPALPLSSAVVKVDVNVRGCPMTQLEFLKVFTSLVMGKAPDRAGQRGLHRVQAQGQRVRLRQKGMICLGPVTRAGCDAQCPTFGQYCIGLPGSGAPSPNVARRWQEIAGLAHGLSMDDARKKPATVQRQPAARGSGHEQGSGYAPTWTSQVHHLTRVEGHGNIVVNMRERRAGEGAAWRSSRPRATSRRMLKGRNFHEAAIITSRICGICSLGHQMTSFKATEQALGLEVSEQTVLLRKLLVHGATLQSNVLHALLPGRARLPEGRSSVFPLVGTHPEVVLRPPCA
jgi:hypothetical protein